LDITQAIILALIQGITEFLPISSSGHLIIPFNLFSWPDQGLAFDTSVHLGSLLAVLWYFRADLSNLTMSTLRHWGGQGMNAEARFAYTLVLATLPIVPVGYFFREFIETNFRGTLVIAVATIGFGLLLWIADRRRTQERSILEITWLDAMIIGLFQCLALIPGTSRSGITMTAALLLGYSRAGGARYSFLLSIPAILGASLLKLTDIIADPTPMDWWPLIVGTAVAGISAYFCIRLFLGAIEKIGFMPFVIYRLILGTALIIWAFN